MSRASTSLDLSEFFNNDDSDGHRLAEFLQKRRGGVQRQNFLFMNCEPERLSLNVQLEKIPPSQQQQNNSDEIKEKQKETVGESGNNKDKNDTVEKLAISVEDKIALLHGDTEGPLSTSNNVNNVPSVPNNQTPHIQPVSPISPARPQSPLIVESPSRPISNPKPLSPSRPLSPRLSSIRKSGGAISPGDRLRRYSLKRLSKIGGVGRRTLLQEFESTVSDSNFEPPVCSTPLSQPQPDKPPSSPTTSHSPDTQNSNNSDTEKNPATNDSCCGHTDTLIRTLQRKDEELKNYMESILENTLKKIQSQEKENQKSVSDTIHTNGTLQTTKSPLKRTYTVEKGNTPGQVILTPDKSSSEENPRHGKLLRSHTEPSPSIKLKTPERNNKNHSMISIRVKSPQSLLSSRNLNHFNPQNENQSIRNQTITNAPSTPNTPNPLNNVSIVFPSQDIEIPETQDLPAMKENSIIIQSGVREMPVVVIPVNQNFNRTYGEEIGKNNNTIITAKTKQSLSTTQALQTAKTNNEEQCKQIDEDNLKLTDILTDDEEETPKTAGCRTIENNNSQAPLNLAPSATNTRTKRLRKRSISRRRLQMDNSQLLSTETETEPPPPAHCSRRMIKKKRIPLNRAPGTPLNGEKFAQELARMSNYEILDLRKRNSLGRVFAISGRKSTRTHEEAMKKQHQLEDQIEMELLRRNIDDITENQQKQNDQTIEKETLIDEFPPVPDEFRDSLDKQDSGDYSLVDEKSSDRISFKNKRNSLKDQKRSSRLKDKPMPEVLKQYLEVSKKLSQNKNKKSLNKSKRSLYTQGHSDSEENQIPKEKDATKEAHSVSRIKRKSIPYVPSPPKSDIDQITTLKVVSPPPPLRITPRKSLRGKTVDEKSLHTFVEINNDDTLPPPPAGFESDSGVSSNNNEIHSATTKTKNTDETTISNTHLNPYPSNSTDSNDKIFKKPLQPAPRRHGRKPKGVETASKEVLQISDSQKSGDDNNNSTDSTGCSLRRSKRGQVPLKQPTPIFQLLYQQSLNRRFQIIEKNKEKQKKKLRENSNANKGINDNTTQSVASKTTNRANKQTQLTPVQENDMYVAALHQDVEILNKKKAPKAKEPKVKRKQNKNNKRNSSNEHFECSRITLPAPPPVDHLNNVFDQLRNTSSTLNQSPTPRPPSPPPPPTLTAVQKVKPFKVRLARIKNSAEPSTKHNSVSICSSSTNSNYELISWLKNITETSDSLTARNEEIFKEMRISPASNLSFTELQGVEYAFYDTQDKASLGYLRFKPRQIKPKKKAKRFHLHFVTLVGNFRITANDKESRIGVGDMVAIEKSVYYDIENITDDIGILMVIKK